MDDLLADFVAETREMLEASAGEIVAWEADPADRSRLDTIFRFVHTVKGNCGFFDFPRLAALSHAAEDALADCRADRRTADRALVSAVLAIIDRIVLMVEAIEAGEDFAEGGDEELIAALEEQAERLTGEAEPLETDADAAEMPNKDATISAQHESVAPKRAEAPPVQRSIRLPVDLLDRVMSGVSDMVLARNDLAHRLSQAGTQPTIDGPFERLTTILSDVRDAITRMRMQRIETLFSALPRLVRDLSNELGKQVLIDLEGGDVELDREMIEMVRDPLTHIIRNAIDHGIETPKARLAASKDPAGMISIAARQSGNNISIVITDDGRGLDKARIIERAIANGLITAEQSKDLSHEETLQLIFEPGLSTADTVSSVSGRGVGMDVVRANIEKLGGSIRVASTPGAGSLFYLQIPLTLAIISGLTVNTGNQRFAIPQSYVEEVVGLDDGGHDYTTIGDTALVTFRGQRIPCLSLASVLGIAAQPPKSGFTLVIVRLANGDVVALSVDSIHSISDLVVKPLPHTVMQTELYGGSTLLDDGQPILVLDVPLIAFNNGIVSDTRITSRYSKGLEDSTPDADTGVHAMLFTGFDGRRSAVRLELVRRIETAPASAIDLSGDQPRVVIDGVILPLIGLPSGPVPVEKVRLLRLTDGTSQMAYAVQRVDDAAQLTAAFTPVASDPLVEAVTLVGEKTVTLVDGHELFARYGEAPEAAQRPICRVPQSDWARTILAPLVEAAGYQITQDTSTREDIAIWFDEEYQAAAALDVEFETPVIRLRDVPDAAATADTVYRYDRNGLIAALRDLRSVSGARDMSAALPDKRAQGGASS